MYNQRRGAIASASASASTRLTHLVADLGIPVRSVDAQTGVSMRESDCSEN